MSRLHLPAGSAADGGYPLAVTPERAGWTYSGLRVLHLAAGRSHTLHTGEEEMLVLPLAGAGAVRCDGVTLSLTGRRDVFSGVTDFCYLPRDASATIASDSGGRFALPSARCARRLGFRYGAAENVPIELRGAGAASRQVNNFCSPEAFECDRLIAVEVLTPGGNWSSWPPHKHDEDRPGESVLEEIYYYEVARDGIGYQRVYGAVEVLAEVRTGDVVLIPAGWHGPSMAAPDYDLYYLNVMAGPGARAWLIRDDPVHAWIRDTWHGQPVDPRLPLTTWRRS
jgi:5-deoxy-glucuronate isomerase